MLLPIVALSGIFQLINIVGCTEISVLRHADGDIFTVEGSCDEACGQLSSDTGTAYAPSSAASSTGITISNGTCICQCNEALPIFREDLNICVSDIHECSVAGFMSNSGEIEKVPYVFLPQRGQIIYPQAEIRFDGVTTPVCGIAGAQQLGKSGLLEFRNLSNAEPPFRLFRDEGRTFLQWIGEGGLRDAAEGKVVIARLVCRDASPNFNHPGVFTPCVAFRVAGSPSKINVREVTFAATGLSSQGLSTIEYTAIGISSVLLALIYVASVSLYLHGRTTRQKDVEEPEVVITGTRDGVGLVKSNPLLAATRHFESDTNSGPSDDDLADELTQSEDEQCYENQVTSAIIHPHCMYMEYPEGPFNAGSIIGERLPEEDVRIVETIENAHQHDAPVLPGTPRRKLYFNPAYFERQLLLAPPPAAIEFLLKIREVISIAKHKMSAKRFVPTLTEIPEEDIATERCTSMTNKHRSGSTQGSLANSRKSQQRCTGCPGCTESASKNPSTPADGVRPTIGDSRVRAWLEGVKPPERRWKDAEDGKRNFQENARTFARSFEYIKEMAKTDFLRSENADFTNKSLASWKDNPPMLRTFQNIARSEILEDVDRHSVSKRSTKSMFEETNYDRNNHKPDKSSSYGRSLTGPEEVINAKVRKAIENSFIKQMEENAVMENKSFRSSESIGNFKNRDNSSTQAESRNSNEWMTPRKSESPSDSSQKKSLKSQGPNESFEDLPDMINELPTGKIPPKRIMDAVIKEMVDVKALENNSKITNETDYEVDSLERTSRNCGRNVVSPVATQKLTTDSFVSSSVNDEKIICKPIEDFRSEKPMNMRIVETEFRLNDDVERRNYYNNLPKLLSQRPEGYSLVSEVYVNDGYASPTGSDDSGPEICYEPEKPGHLTIKVQDSPDNYVKHDDSEYEPDTLDRKPMRLKINGDVIYDRETSSESYVDSLERPGQISLRSKGSFRDDGNLKNCGGSLQRGYGSLREIYEARLRSNLRDSNLMSSTRSLNDDLDDNLSWKKNKYLTPDTRHARRQRKPQSQPDVVPLPPAEAIYQNPKPPRPVENDDCKVDVEIPIQSKNERDRSQSEAGYPTTGNGTSVPEKIDERRVGNSSIDEKKIDPDANRGKSKNFPKRDVNSKNGKIGIVENSNWSRKIEFDRKSGFRETTKKSNEILNDRSKTCEIVGSSIRDRRHADFVDCAKISKPEKKKYFADSTNQRRWDNKSGLVKIEDSGYLSSTDSNGSHKQLLRHDFGSVSETDETESICDGASESGAESVGTDSVFFGNFRRLSAMSNFSKSADSGVDLGMRNYTCKNFDTRNVVAGIERTGNQTSDSETESFVTVLQPESESRRNSLVL